jgi:hypothetical protein
MKGSGVWTKRVGRVEGKYCKKGSKGPFLIGDEAAFLK